MPQGPQPKTRDVAAKANQGTRTDLGHSTKLGGSGERAKPTEAADLARKIEAVLAPLAAERVGGRPSKTGANLAPVSEPKTRDVAAKAAGRGHESIRKVRVVQEVVESEATPEPVRAVAREALAEVYAAALLGLGPRFPID